MTRPNTTETRKLSDSDITQEIKDLRKELFDLRFQQATRQLDKTHRFKEVRIKLAQLLTIQGERIRSNNSSSS